jgi:shikimate dehydrogenase
MGVPYAEVIGDPIAHSKSPLIHKFWLEKLGIEGDYRARRVHHNDLGDYFSEKRRDLAWHGCSITSPHKTAAIDYLDDFASEAVAVGAINCVYRSGNRLVGTNTDVDGIDEVLDLYPWSNRMVTLLGAGGAARAVLEALRRRSTLEIFMIVRSPDDARSLHRAFARSGAVHSFDKPHISFSTSEYVINATPLGMTDQPPMPDAVLDELSRVSHDATVFDMVYTPVETELLKRAGALSLNTISGLHMLVGQARRAFQYFFGAAPPLEHDAELLELLAQ